MSVIIAANELDFLLFEYLKSNELLEYDQYKDHDMDTFKSVLDLSNKLATEFFLDHNAKADYHEPRIEGETVKTIDEVKLAWKQFAESGLLGAKNSYDEGGMQLPHLIHTMCTAHFAGANPSTMAYSFLTEAAANVIKAFGSEDQRNRYMQYMYQGRFAGTMALTEPDVGSSLGDLTTQAQKNDDGSYNITGQKIYISGGEQDITENIVHLVLARTKDAPSGVKGISLFIVPKFLVADNGEITDRNDVHLAGLFHKMGYRGTSSTVLSFGENQNCKGFLIGEENHGLKYMFKMMNEARIGVGVGASMIAMRGYLASLKYAKERSQGRLPSDKTGGSKPISIIEHADVKRMLLAQKVYAEGSLALCLFAARLMDEIEARGDKDSIAILDLLTPIVKSYPAYYGPKANDLAIQVLGGAGYIREFPVEQCYRDNRLNPIHEGTHGIQALDLLGRKLWQDDSKGLMLLLKNKVEPTLKKARAKEELKELTDNFIKHLGRVQNTVKTLGVSLQQGKVDLTLANATLFLDVVGRLITSWLWIDMANQAIDSYGDSSEEDKVNFVKGKIQAATYSVNWELPEIVHATKILDRLDSTCFDMQPEWF